MRKNIVLIGMPGSGKTTIGHLLSKELHMNFIDMDDYIEKKENKTIKELFSISEIYFRNIESKHTVDIGNLDNHIISTGGGIIKRDENMINLRKNSIIVFINRPLKNIMNDINTTTRPLLSDGKEKLYKLYEERYELYKKYCDIEILNNKDILDVVTQIIKKVGTYDENNCN